MIQSDKFDSFDMNIKIIANSVLTFIVKRLIEISGIIVSFFGILLLIALISFSPSDPNFIFPENTEIKNLLGIRGSYLSDLFLQSIGFISYLVSLTLIFTGISIYKKKEIFLIIENIFFTIPYCLIGSFFLDYFFNNTFELYINGCGGFVGTITVGGTGNTGETGASGGEWGQDGGDTSNTGDGGDAGAAITPSGFSVTGVVNSNTIKGSY